ncbi:MAG: SHOCT domain-containing protein [Dictyoglomaceae bacterium]|nr:SHOCT domain-containing protein [Dictyoglomaceae bacterium]
MCFWSWRFPYFGNRGFWDIPFAMFFNLILGIGLVLLIFYVIKIFSKSYRKDEKEVLLNNLKRRLTMGEITQEEYERIKKLLEL